MAGVVALALAACGGGADDGDAGGDEFSVAASLEQIPAVALDGATAPIQVVAGDLDRAAEVAGVERPAALDVDAVVDWIGPLTGRADEGAQGAVLLPPEVVGVTSLTRIEEFDAELGWSLLDVHRYVELQQPPQFVSVLSGEFDEAALDAAQGERRDGIWSLGGDDFEIDPAQRSAARPLGGSMRSALVDGRLVVGRGTAPVRAAADGADGSLRDDGSLAAVATALDAEDVYGALLVALDPGAGGAGDGGLGPFDALGVGSAADGDGALVVLADAHGVEADADANVERLRALFTDGRSLASGRPWSDLLTLEDVARDGTTVTATLRPSGDVHPMIAYQAVFQRDAFAVPG